MLDIPFYIHMEMLWIWVKCPVFIWDWVHESTVTFSGKQTADSNSNVKFIYSWCPQDFLKRKKKFLFACSLFSKLTQIAFGSFFRVIRFSKHFYKAIERNSRLFLLGMCPTKVNNMCWKKCIIFLHKNGQHFQYSVPTDWVFYAFWKNMYKNASCKKVIHKQIFILTSQ